jgi:hypothetical protein
MVVGLSFLTTAQLMVFLVIAILSLNILLDIRKVRITLYRLRKSYYYQPVESETVHE